MHPLRIDFNIFVENFISIYKNNEVENFTNSTNHDKGFTQQTFTCLIPKIETLEKGVKYVQS